MKFGFFIQSIVLPVAIAIGGFLTINFVSSFVTQAEFSDHKIKDERNIVSIVTKLDVLIESHKELKAELRRVRR